MKEMNGPVELIGYYDHASANDITLDNQDFYSKNPIQMYAIGLVIYEDDVKIHLLHNMIFYPSQIQPFPDNMIELAFHVIIKGAVFERVVLKKDMMIKPKEKSTLD